MDKLITPSVRFLPILPPVRRGVHHADENDVTRSNQPRNCLQFHTQRKTVHSGQLKCTCSPLNTRTSCSKKKYEDSFCANCNGKDKSPQLNDGGTGFPPRDDGNGGGGGGNGGGGGANWSWLPYLSWFLYLLGFLGFLWVLYRSGFLGFLGFLVFLLLRVKQGLRFILSGFVELLRLGIALFKQLINLVHSLVQAVKFMGQLFGAFWRFILGFFNQGTSSITTIASGTHPTMPETARYGYDVFINLSGKDTRMSSGTHLYKALEDAGIEFSMNSGLKSGEIISFSTNIAGTRWCVAELGEDMMTALDIRRRK